MPWLLEIELPEAEFIEMGLPRTDFGSFAMTWLPETELIETGMGLAAVLPSEGFGLAPLARVFGFTISSA